MDNVTQQDSTHITDPETGDVTLMSRLMAEMAILEDERYEHGIDIVDARYI